MKDMYTLRELISGVQIGALCAGTNDLEAEKKAHQVVYELIELRRLRIKIREEKARKNKYKYKKKKKNRL